MTITTNPAQASENINLGRLKSLGILSPEFVPFLLPRKYLDLRDDQLITNFIDLPAGEKCTLYGTLGDFDVRRDSIPSRVIVRIFDHMQRVVSATFFGDPRVVLKEIEGHTGFAICLRGSIDYYNGLPQLKNPSIIDDKLLGRVVPVYPGKPKVISPATVFSHMEELLPLQIPLAADWLRKKLSWSKETEIERISVMPGMITDPCIENMLKTIHSPPTPLDGLHASRLLRLIATFDVLAGARTEGFRKPSPGSAVSIPSQILNGILAETDLIPTDEQLQVINDICGDIASDNPMYRLLSADVGFGKTYVAGAAGAAVARMGGTVVWLSPNQPLAVQTRDNIAGWWPDLEPGLVVGDSSKMPDTRFLIGTTALLHRLPADFHPDLLVIDEEQKFGSSQKNDLAGPSTNILKATATSIPRTAALLEFGGMAVSRLTKAHVTKEIKTRLVMADNRGKLFASIKRNVQNGHQALIIYPLAETKDAELIDKKSAEGAYALWEKHFPGRVRYMHGKLKEQEKLSAIAAMRSDEADILISTIAVETGIDLPRLRHVVIVHPERLGLNTLHQIRGRVARKGGVGICDLFLPEPISDDSRKRLDILVRHTDGFDVATENMKLQGFGDMGTSGVAQSGKSISFLPGHTLEYIEIKWVADRWL